MVQCGRAERVGGHCRRRRIAMAWLAGRQILLLPVFAARVSQRGNRRVNHWAYRLARRRFLRPLPQRRKRRAGRRPCRRRSPVYKLRDRQMVRSRAHLHRCRKAKWARRYRSTVLRRHSLLLLHIICLARQGIGQGIGQRRRARCRILSARCQRMGAKRHHRYLAIRQGINTRTPEPMRHRMATEKMAVKVITRRRLSRLSRRRSRRVASIIRSCHPPLPKACAAWPGTVLPRRSGHRPHHRRAIDQTRAVDAACRWPPRSRRAMPCPSLGEAPFGRSAVAP